MNIFNKYLEVALLVFLTTTMYSQVYPPQQQLVFETMPSIPKPGYLSPITDPTFGTTVIRVTDRAVFDTHDPNSRTWHKYSKNQPWNSDGTLIHMGGWPGAVLDPQTYQVLDMVRPPGGPNTWSNTQSNIMYGTNKGGFGDNCIVQLDVNTNTYSAVSCFSQYTKVSYGEYEGNMSNDDRYMALQCIKPGGAMEVACYDFVSNSIVSTTNAPVWPNNVTMSQSGDFIMIQWNVYGTGQYQGTWIYNRNLSPIGNIDAQGGSHIDLGYDTQGNEVAVGTMGNNRRLRMKRLDNGSVTNLLSDAQMSWYIHVSCRNIDRPGYAYISDFEDPNSQINKPYYQRVFAVKLDPNANDNALTESFAHIQHSTNVQYDREAHAVPNRDGSIVMFKSDWRGNSSSEINSYIAFMPGNTSCNFSCSASQTSAPTCDGNNGSATVAPQGGTTPFTYLWNDPQAQSSATANGLGAGNYSVTIIDANNCTTSCNVTLVDINSLSCSGSQTSAPTCGNNNGSATVTPQGGTPPYTYLWNDPQAQTAATANGLGSGTYSVNVIDANNCTSSCTVTVTGAAGLTCVINETTAPNCGGNNGVATVTPQGGIAPYNFLWSDTQNQTSSSANGLLAGNYTVVVTDANNCTTQCSITLTDPSSLSCTTEETTPPSAGGNDGVAKVIPEGGTVTTGDPRTDLLASPAHIGYGAAATGGTNYVYVTNFNQLKNALETSGNYVLLDPSLAGQGIGFPGRINPASNTTLDGSLAPDSWLFPDYISGFPANTSMFNHFSTNNSIIYSIEMRGNRVSSNFPSGNVGAFNVRGSNIWYDHITITDFSGQSIMIAQGGNNISLSNLKIVNTVNGVWLYYPNDTPRYISLFNSVINAQQNAPYNDGASHFHMWNNYIHGSLYGASLAGFGANSAPGQNGPIRTLSENNVFSNNAPAAEFGLPSGGNWGGPIQIPGYIYSSGAIYNNGDVVSGNVVSPPAPWTIPYSYSLVSANQVEAYVATNAGKILVTGNTTYSFLWDDPMGQTSAIATGLAAGTYQVTVSDATGCSTVCSITMTGSPVVCNIGVWLEGAFDANMEMMENSLQQIAVLPSGQPYGIAPWNYSGNEGTGWQPSDYPAGSVDWVLLSFRTTVQPGSEVARVAALLMEDGNIVPASLELSTFGATSYYIVVEHRNHLPAMSSSAVPIVNNTLSYDFRSGNSYNQGTGFGQTQLGTEWAMYAGDADQASPVGYEVTGADLILWQAANGFFSTYLPEDINMDGDVNGLDRLLLNLNNGISSSVMK